MNYNCTRYETLGNHHFGKLGIDSNRHEDRVAVRVILFFRNVTNSVAG